MLGGVQPALADDETVNSQIDAILGDHTQYEPVIRAFQQAVVDHDAEGVADLVNYPIKVSIDGSRTSIRSAAAFVENYDAIITPDMADAIAAQNYGSLFVRDQGVMFGSGEVWISGICLDSGCQTVDVKVSTIQHAN
jgi:hypothetical protein